MHIATNHLEELHFTGGRSGTQLSTIQWLPAPLDRVFGFFSDAFQLETLTPPWLKFRVLTPGPISISAGTRIDYQLTIHGIPLRWQSLISVWEPQVRFVDEQTRGPYRRWRHEHRFEAIDGGTLCKDIVDYAVYGGRIIDQLLIRRDLRTIFTFRQQRLRQLFPE